MRRTLRDRFGLRSFRPGQAEVIRNVLEGIDTLALMPTGSGKSLCYQLPALLLPGTTVVVSPLIALMRDQADKLLEAGVPTDAINSMLGTRDEAQALGRISAARSEIVLVTPERLANPDFLAQLARNPIDVFVIDEAHCVSQWGHDFRPAYLEIALALPALGNPPVLALTATAGEQVIEDIRRQLGRPEMRIVNASMYRPNLHYAVRQVTNDEEKLAALRRTLARVPGASIVYVATVKAAEHVHQALSGDAREILLYHGRLGRQAREDSQQRFMQSSSAVMIATNAFGLGIDKADVRAVIHWQMPASLEAYYQESGRAGRDGEDALCGLLFQHSDRRIQAFFLAGRYPGVDEVEAAWLALAAHSEASTAAELGRWLHGIAASKLRVALKALCDAGFAAAAGGRYRTIAPSLQRGEAERVAEGYRLRTEQDRNKLEQLIAYAQTGRCRWLTLLEYFGESPGWSRCGTCDNCRHPPRVPETQTGRTEAPAATGDGIALGQRVRVPRLGVGLVTALSAQAVTISFPDGSQRPFLRSYVEPAPEAE